jgi:hypothetical protein
METGRAKAIYQDWLDMVSRQMMDGAFDALAASMVYPNRMETADGVLIYATPEEMTASATSFRSFLQSLGATDYHRICDTAEFDAEGTGISGEHTTYILKGGNYALRPYRNRMRLQLDGGTWKGAGLAAAVLNHTCTILPPDMLRDRLKDAT